MARNDFTFGSFGPRFAFALALVLLTYNTSGFSWVGGLTSDMPLVYKVASGVVLLIVLSGVLAIGMSWSHIRRGSPGSTTPMKSRVSLVILLSVLTGLALPAMAANVILLHGLARTDKSMGKIEGILSRQGYCVTNVSYDSRDGDIETLASKAIVPALIDCPPADQVHFVTHSLGGILLRQYLSNDSIENLGRVVMLGPPNNGSEVVDELRKVPGFDLWNGEAGLELGTDANSVPRRLGSANFELGVIAGTSSINPLLSNMIPGPDDGKVSVESTRLEGMSDHIEMEVTHTFMMLDDEVIKQVISFLQSGKFMRTD